MLPAVLLSQVVHHYHPRLVELHNYSSTLSLAAKRSNWQTLNTKVLRRLQCAVSGEEIERLVKGEKGAIERLLLRVEARLREWEEAERRRQEEGRAADADSEDALGQDGELMMLADGTVYPYVAAMGAQGRGGSAAGGSKDQIIIADQRDAIEVYTARTVEAATPSRSQQRTHPCPACVRSVLWQLLKQKVASLEKMLQSALRRHHKTWRTMTGISSSAVLLPVPCSLSQGEEC